MSITTVERGWETLESPSSMRNLVPGSPESSATTTSARRSIRRVMNGDDDRLLVIVGPCSLHDRDAAVEYAGLLREIAEELADDLLVVMRAYVEKSRSALGWPGMVMMPGVTGPAAPDQGLHVARSLLAEITGMGVPVAMEWTNVFAPAYLDDLVSWGCLGARSVEAQAFRQLASALTMPVGMKNRTDGAVRPAVDAVRVASSQHALLAITQDGSVAVARTGGNPDCHVVLRGGAHGPNHHPAGVRAARRLLREAGLPERVLVDASHGNCDKDHARQRFVAGDIGGQVGAGDTAIRGVMLESFLLPGRQDVVSGRPLTYGRSVTDPCMGWSTTAEVLTGLAADSRRRRRAHATVIPTPRTVSVPPAETAVAVAGLFDTHVVYERDGVWTVAGGVRTAITLDATRIRLRGGGLDRSWPWHDRPLGLLGDVLAQLPDPEWSVYGWIAFEAAHLLTGRPELAGGDLAHLVVPAAEIRIDPTGATVTCADEALRARIDDAMARVRSQAPAGTVAVDVDRDGDWYAPAVADAVRQIQAGAFEKVVLSRSVPVEQAIDLARTYLAGRAANTPARSFLLDLGGVRAAGFCPETLLEVAGNRVSTQPLAGTRSFGNGTDRDLALRRELCRDPKEIYEHITSVRLACDELARVCVPDSVAVSELMTVKQRGSVQHLASRVSGDLAAGLSTWDALEALFPAVTASGIPKAPACEYLARTEPGPRGLYSGVVLTATHDGSLDAGLVLRTVFEQDGRRWLRAGAGIVGSSRPEREYEETCEKLRSVAPYLVPGPG